MVVAHVVVFLAGASLVVAALVSAVQTLVLPRATPSKISRLVFVTLRRVLLLFVRRNPDWRAHDRVLALNGPLGLLLLPGVWLLLVVTGYTAMLWSVGLRPLREAFIASGSSYLTLGFARPETLPQVILSFSEAAIGLGLVALLISYLPVIYAAFSRRENLVALLEVLAGEPPSPVEMLVRHQRIGAIDRLPETWERWQQWFAEVEESHTSFGSLAVFRSPVPERSWVTAAGCVLDTAAIVLSTLDIPRQPDAALCLRSGFVSLRRIATFYGIPHPTDPAPDDPTSVTREEFDAAVDQLRDGGLPTKADRDQCWRDFNGWRVNYDAPLVGLAALTQAPPAMWSSDRGAKYRRPPLRGTRVIR